MGHQRFFSIVGCNGAGKTELQNGLKKTLGEDRCVFLCDSSGSGDTTPHASFTRRVTSIAKEGVHEHATPRSQLLLFWSRLNNIIEHDVRPNLEAGKLVFMDGFGGTILTHAKQHAKSHAEREQLLELHKSMIKHCVIEQNVPPPIYILLRPSAHVALDRLQKAGKELGKKSISYIEDLNRGFEFYGKLEGQTVVPIDADQPPERVLAEALSIIHSYVNKKQIAA